MLLHLGKDCVEENIVAVTVAVAVAVIVAVTVAVIVAVNPHDQAPPVG
jgi:hypothetical protein